MKLVSCFIIFIAITNLWLAPVISQSSDSCSVNLKLNGLLFDTTSSLNCLSVWDAQGYILRYTKTASNLWSFVLSAPDTNSFVGMGFSPNGGMVGSSAIVGWISSSDGTGNLKQYYLGGTSPNRVFPDEGNLTVVSNTSSMITQSTRLYLAFQLETTQPLSRVIYSAGPVGFSPVAPAYRLTEHRNKIATSINYSTGQSASSGTPHLRLRRSHGVLNMIGWGILIIIGAMVARYARQWEPFWFYAHIGVQLLAFLFGIIGVVCGFLLENRLNSDVSTHKGLGIFIFVLACLQVTALLARPNKEAKTRKYWNWYHYTVGRILVVFAIANVFYGIHLGGEGKGWNAGYGAVLFVLFVASALFEYRMWMRK
ncbi:hypothetical protein UlMin_032016 [Ulmus minor]